MSTAEKLDVQIKMRTLIRADIQRCYDAVATADGFDAWFTTGSVIEPYPGGVMQMNWQDWGVDHVDLNSSSGRVLEAKPPTRFVFQWGIGTDWGPSTIEFDFEETDEGTVVQVIDHGHANNKAGREMLSQCACGWGEAMTLMKFWLEHGVLYFGDSKTLAR